MLKKYKKEISIFLIGFITYFISGIVLSSFLNTANYWNVMFDFDTPRVLGDLSIFDYNHYRISVHPLFVIMFQPIVLLINLILKDSISSIILMQSLLAGLSLMIFSISINKICKNKKLSLIITLLFGTSFAQIVYSSAIETYIFAQFFLILLWLFSINKCDKKLNYWDYILLVLLGIGSLAVTITNFIQFIIAIFFIITLNKKNSNRIFTSIFIVITVIAFSVLLAEVQNIIWPTAPNFFTKAISDLLYSTSEESLYITKSVSFNNVLNVLNSNFAYPFNIFNLSIPAKGIYLTFENNLVSNIFSILCGLIFVVLNVIFIKKNIKTLNKHKIYIAMLITYLFNFALHLVYGNNIAFLYICHYNFLILFIITYVINNLFKLETIKTNWLLVIVTTIIILSIRGIYLMYSNIIPLYNFVEYFRLFPFALVAALLTILISILFKKNRLKIIIILLVCILLFGLHHMLNHSNHINNEMELYIEKLELYQRQLKDMRNEYNVRSYADKKESEKLKIYFFGMANRTKILYKDGKLIDIKTKKILKEFNYKEELIIPNEYTVILKDSKDNIIKIYENEMGIFISQNNKLETLVKSTQELNLPEFEEHQYSEILKVLHQELLFNIDGEVPKPNIFGYTTAWYRDAMLGTKVLEITNNTDLLVPWIKSVDSIYDYSRSKDIKETDNLGELLYIIGAVGVERKDLVNEITKEIYKLKKEDGSIGGNVDGLIQSYYPTVLALHGASKVGITLDLTVPQYDDGYAKLTWYNDNPIASGNTQHSSFYPYINWAFYNYSPYSSTLYILDEYYPLSYEGGDTSTPGKITNECFVSDYYCEHNLYLAHMWHASEMFLFLIEE